ncbi:hypothetical protein EYF80_049450 [Liparis tanakae]|uniref:Uncharacterized protein n=1 Tax=Liparis tanakae TaxID=230148 RepID=A0A4Z2FJD2_9TELE|nr:hypothetical protein EYF80_049450 [Liparis tanakae]
MADTLRQRAPPPGALHLLYRLVVLKLISVLQQNPYYCVKVKIQMCQQLLPPSTLQFGVLLRPRLRPAEQNVNTAAE